MALFSDLKAVLSGEKKMVTPNKTFVQCSTPNLIPEEKWGETFHYNDRRYYKAPNGGIYPSVTTFLGQYEDSAGLIAWRKRVGDAEADRISNRSMVRGTNIHLALEHYVAGIEFDALAAIGEEFIGMFHQIRLALHKGLDSWDYMEHALYSEKMLIAGRVDLKGVWEGRSAIIDFKNKNTVWSVSDMDDYFKQACCYAIMHEEMYGEQIQDLVLIVSTEDNPSKIAKVYVSPFLKWRDFILELNESFKRNHKDWYDIPPLLRL